jgi:hypothetical protein
MQPQDIKDNLDEVITNAVNKPQVSQIGTSFLLFCGKNQLIKISESITFYIKWLNQPYIGPLKSVKEAA